MQNVTVNVNGQITGFDQAQISVFDRGYLYGDSLYEVVRSYGSQFFLLDEHLNRLQASAQLNHMNLGHPLSFYKQEIFRTFEAYWAKAHQHDAYIRLIVSRGIGKIGFGPSGLLSAPHFVIIAQPVDSPQLGSQNGGIRLKVVERLRNDRRALDPALKSGNYLNSLLAYLEATADGFFDDALLCNAEEHITEGTTFNIFYLRSGILATPPLDIGILHGITRAQTIECAKQLKIPVREVRFPKERLYEADEVFITSSIREILPVTQVDQKQIGHGKQGRFTQMLHSQFRTMLPNLAVQPEKKTKDSEV